MGMPATPEPVTTIEELLALPEDGLRHELLDGVHVVTPAPQVKHQLVVTELVSALRTALPPASEYRVLTSPADIVIGPRTLVQPDVFVARLPGTGASATWRELGVPLIAVEVLSPGTAARDRATKRRLYQRAGVAEYWIVDPDARVVERWHPWDERPEIVEGRLAFELPGVVGEIDIRAVLLRALGE
jgi:Uma2 family endonuclease